jgi:hypothetical protein
MTEKLRQNFADYLPALLASVAGLVFLHYFFRHSGIGISPDSVSYSYAAEHFSSENRFNNFTGLPLVEFPLGYPATLWFMGVVSGVSVSALAPVMNMVLFAGLLILSNRLLLSLELPLWLRCAVLACLCCSPCLLEVYSMLWSETLFLFLSVLFFVLLRWYGKHPVFPRLLLLAIVCSLGMVTRYAGVSLLAVGLFFLFFDPDTTAKQKTIRILLFVLLSSSLLGINLLRNSHYLHELTGVRERSVRGLSEISKETGTTISDWLPLLHNHPLLTTVLFIALFFVTLLLVIKRLLQIQFLKTPVTVLLVAWLFYAGFMIGAAYFSRFEYLTNRLLSPLYVPMFIVWPAVLYKGAKQQSKTIRKAVILFLALGFIGVQIQYYQLNAEAWDGIKDAGIPGYSEDSWTQMPLVQYLKQHPPPGIVYANAPDATWYLCGIRSKPLPHKELLSELQKLLQTPAFQVIWFVDGDNPDLVSFDFLKAHARMVSINKMEGGWVAGFEK